MMWSLVYALLVHAGAAWHGVTIDHEWDVDYDYLLPARHLTPADPDLATVWTIDVSGRWSRAACVPADSQIRVLVDLLDTKEFDKGDVREIRWGAGGTRLDNQTGKFDLEVRGTAGVYHGKPVKLRLTFLVDNSETATVVLPGTVRLKK